MKTTEQGERFLAVDHRDWQTCAALGWQWLSIQQYVVAGAAKLLDAIELAWERGHNDVLVYDRMGSRSAGFRSRLLSRLEVAAVDRRVRSLDIDSVLDCAANAASIADGACYTRGDSRDHASSYTAHPALNTFALAVRRPDGYIAVDVAVGGSRCATPATAWAGLDGAWKNGQLTKAGKAKVQDWANDPARVLIPISDWIGGSK